MNFIPLAIPICSQPIFSVEPILSFHRERKSKIELFFSTSIEIIANKHPDSPFAKKVIALTRSLQKVVIDSLDRSQEDNLVAVDKFIEENAPQLNSTEALVSSLKKGVCKCFNENYIPNKQVPDQNSCQSLIQKYSSTVENLSWSIFQHDLSSIPEGYTSDSILKNFAVSDTVIKIKEIMECIFAMDAFVVCCYFQVPLGALKTYR